MYPLFKVTAFICLSLLQIHYMYVVAADMNTQRFDEVSNIFTVNGLNLTLAPSTQYLSQNSRTLLEEIFTAFVKDQLLILYNQSSYHFSDAGVFISNVFTWTRKGNCRYVKRGLSEQVTYVTELMLQGFAQFQDSPVPDTEMVSSDFISAMSDVALLSDYVSKANIPQLQNITYSIDISKNNTNMDSCIITTPQRSTKNVIVGVCISGGIVFIAALCTIIFWRSRRTKWRKIKKRGLVLRVKHLSDDHSIVLPDNSNVGHGMNRNSQESDLNENDGRTWSKSLANPEIIENGDNQFFEPIGAFSKSPKTMKDDDDSKANYLPFPFHFDNPSIRLQAVSPLPSAIAPNGTSVSSMNTNIGAFPTKFSKDSMQHPQQNQSGTIAIESDSSTHDSLSFYNHSLTYSGDSRIHPLDWSNKSSNLDGQSIGNSTLTDGELFIVRRAYSPTILEHNNESIPQLSGNAKVKVDNMPAATARDRQFINDLVWLKQKLSNVRGESNEENSSQYSDD